MERSEAPAQELTRHAQDRSEGRESTRGKAARGGGVRRQMLIWPSRSTRATGCGPVLESNNLFEPVTVERPLPRPLLIQTSVHCRGEARRGGRPRDSKGFPDRRATAGRGRPRVSTPLCGRSSTISMDTVPSSPPTGRRRIGCGQAAVPQSSRRDFPPTTAGSHHRCPDSAVRLLSGLVGAEGYLFVGESSSLRRMPKRESGSRGDKGRSSIRLQAVADVVNRVAVAGPKEVAAVLFSVRLVSFLGWAHTMSTVGSMRSILGSGEMVSERACLI